MKLLQKVIIFICLPILVDAQNDNVTNINSIANQLQNNIRSVRVQQIVLQTNKKIYTTKENIWFKVFEIDSSTGIFTNTDKILYADLVDENDKVVHHLRLNISTAHQDGAFPPDSSLSGFYWIRAYTKNILDHNINNIGVKPVYILNPNGKRIYGYKNNQSSAQTTSTNDFNLALFPEGNCLISGAPSLVAVKLSGPGGEPVSDSILIKDNRNEITARFATNANGLGKFVFEPSIYKTYGVFILKNNHYDSVTALPRINPFAVQLAVTEQTDQTIKARVLLEDSVYTKDYKTFLIALNKDSICFAAVGQGNYEINIPSSDFSGGISHLLLYNKDGELVNERDIYINKNSVSVAVQTDNKMYAAREKVNMNISVTNNGKPVRGVFSVAVNDSRVADSVNNFVADTLANLSSNDADLVVLTHKQNLSNRQSLNNLKNNLTPEQDTSLFINGLLSNNKNEPVANKAVLLLSNNQNGFVLQDTTNAKGKFSFEVADFNTGMPFTMQVNGDNNTSEDYHISLDSSSSYNFKTPTGLKEYFSAEQLQSLKKTQTFYENSILAGQEWLPEVTVKGKSYPKETNIFPETIISKELLHTGSVHNVADAVLRYSKLHVIGGYLMAGGPNGFRPGPTDEPLIVLDGSRLNSTGGDLAFLRTISTSDVDHIRILTGASAASYGVLLGTGVIEIYSASNSTYSDVKGGGLATIYPKGFDSASKFETPDYDDKRLKNYKGEDSRTSIYWNGNIITDENGNANISFYTADIPAQYIVTITGITVTGDKVFKTVTLNNK